MTETDNFDSINKKPPTRIAQKWVRYVVGFGVTVCIGLSPFLGNLNVPGFRPVLDLFPQLPFDSRATVIPLSSFLMGALAVVVQFYSEESIRKGRLKTLFIYSLIIALIAFLILFIVHTLTVEEKSIQGGQQQISVLLGFYRPGFCKECSSPQMSNSECLDHTTLNPSRIRSCWGDKQIKLAFLALALPYFSLTSAFGLMVGTLIIRDEVQRRK